MVTIFDLVFKLNPENNDTENPVTKPINGNISDKDFFVFSIILTLGKWVGVLYMELSNSGLEIFLIITIF